MTNDDLELIASGKIAPMKFVENMQVRPIAPLWQVVDELVSYGAIILMTEGNTPFAQVRADRMTCTANYLRAIIHQSEVNNTTATKRATAPPQGNQPPASQEPATGRELPTEIDTEQARKYFARAVAAGLMSEQFEWLASQSLLACFCREMSVNLDLGKGYSSEGQKRLSWKPFEALFNVKAKNLRTSLNDIKKTGQDPIGIEKVEAIFKD